MNLMRMFRPPQRVANFVDGRVGYAVGDVHGQAGLLTMLLEELEARAASDVREGGPPIVVFLGDYVDRGAHSDQVIDLLLSGHPQGFERHFLRGNHEQIMLAFMEDPVANRAWIMQGGAETLLAYGVHPPTPMASSKEEWHAAADALRAALPEAHLAFLQGLERYVAFGDYAFVHAGVDPARALEAQTDEDLYWTRERFISSRRTFSHRVVHGHTPVDKPYADHRRIAVDTGAYASGELTAVRLEGEKVEFVSVKSQAVNRGDTPRLSPLVGARNPV